MENIQWYPGHMTKTRRMMQANISLVDIVIELLDARLPYSSKNPDIDELAQHKRRLVVLNKADLADPSITREWEVFYRAQGFVTMTTNAHEKKIASRLDETARRIMQEKIQREKQRGRQQVIIRAMVVGIPNVGKSTFINQLAKGSPTTTGDRPGVTRGKQWVNVKKGFDVLDTPGVLWPKFEDVVVGQRLAFTGAITDHILDSVTLSEKLIAWLMENYPKVLATRYKVEENLPPNEMLEAIGIARSFKIKGGAVDIERAANTLLDEFRGGKLGRITLETVES